LAAVRVYEVDLPENVAYKKQQLESMFGAVPAHVTLVPVDFEEQTLSAALKHSGYSFEHKTVFVWEAVTQYLTEMAVRETLRVLAQAQTGSRLLFTYVLQDFLDGTNRYGLDSLYQRFRVKSDLWKFGLHTDAVDAFTGNYGWTVLEQAGAEEYSSRYLQPADRSGTVAEIERIVYAQKQ
jgi:methyltransferase (TIGR00027 family)